MRKKPSWDTAEEGVHPALKNLRPEPGELDAIRKYTEEARLLMASPGASQATRNQRWVATQRHAATFHHANFNLFDKRLKNKERADVHRRGLATALMNLGEFDTAMALVAYPSSGRARNGFKELVHTIGLLALAVYRDDGPLCNCDRRQAEVPHPQLTKSVTIELNRHHVVGQVLSPKHGKVVDVWRCSICKRVNAHDMGPPERQRLLHDIRAGLAIRPLKSTSELPVAAGDHALLSQSVKEKENK